MADNNVQQKIHYKSLGIAVHKFGGSSLATATQLKRVANMIKEQTKAGDIIVVSANGVITDWLIDFYHGNKVGVVVEIKEFYSKICQELFEKENDIIHRIEADLSFLQDNKISYDEFISFGERWSSLIVTKLLNQIDTSAIKVDATSILKILPAVDEEFIDTNHANIILESIYKNHLDKRLVVEGFVASNYQGKKVILGRNGSDFSATLIAELVQASKVVIWTDVDAIYSADPNLIKSPIKLDTLSLCEAQALSELGANVLHQKTILPLLNHRADVFIRSSFSEDRQGTLITKDPSDEHKVKTIAIKKGLKRVTITHINELSVRIIQQKFIEEQIAYYASSFDKSLARFSFYIESADVFNTVSIIKAKQFYPLVEQEQLAIISLVGQNIRQKSDVLIKFLLRLEKFEIKQIHYPTNAHALCVIAREDIAHPILQDLHETFFALEPSIPIVVLGYGNIGKQFIKILSENKNEIEQRINRSLSILAIANSRYFSFDDICLTRFGNDYFSNVQSNKNNQIFDYLKKYRGKELVIIDLTASKEIAQNYLQFAEHFWHIISANKIAASDYQFATRVSAILESNHRQWLKNTTAGAALPVQSSIKKIKESGDRIRRISGVFSGSLSWLFNQYNGQQSFTDLLKIAGENAFTEPDPREDLSGNDVIRKIRILAQEAGFLNIKEDFESATPERFLKGDLDDFWTHQEAINEYYTELYRKAKEQGGKLCYIASLDEHLLSLKLTIIEHNHPFANLNPCDNIFSIETDWYKDNPLIIQGPGAGREVTAAGVLNDLCDLLRAS